MRALMLTLVPLLLLPGCLAPEPAETLATDAPLAGAAPHFWAGARLKAEGYDGQDEMNRVACWVGAPCETTDPACEAANCERTPIRLDAPAPFLEASIRWPSDPVLVFALRLEDATGAVVARGLNPYLGTTGLTAMVADAPAGEYEAVVVILRGESAYEGVFQVEPARPTGAVELLPNLVALPPTDLTLETPAYTGVSYFVFPAPLVRDATEAAGAVGCRLDEALEQGARRCLRFTTAVGNLGDGPLEVHLDAAGHGRQFVQRVHSADGTYTETEAGEAEWHATHAHWHNAASNVYTVHPVDPETGALGEAAYAHEKVGICFADTGLADLGLPRSAPAAYDGMSCMRPESGSTWSAGVSPTWMDVYAYPLSEQYVDIAGAPDGEYALCVQVNPNGLLRESDPDDNTGCARFRLTGNEVEVLSPEPYHRIPDAARMK